MTYAAKPNRSTRRWTTLFALLGASVAFASNACSSSDPTATAEDAPVTDQADASSPTPPSAESDASGFNFDGTGETKACRGLQCQQESCGAGGDTTLTGTVYAPNGTLPIYNAIVYVPNDKLAPVTKGITCDQCGTTTSGSPITVALSDATGKFTLTNVPIGTNVPLVIQLGKWRRQVTIPEVKRCVENKVTDHELTRLPKKQSEGNMPHVAVTSGGCDNLGCMLPKIGIDPSEFGVAGDGDAKAVHLYTGQGGQGPSGAMPASGFWSDFNQLKQYDLAIFSCECSEAPGSKGTYGSPAFKAVTDYLGAGGRIFTSDLQYTWYRDSPDPQLGRLVGGGQTQSQTGIGLIPGGAPVAANPITLDTSFPKGKALADWLSATPGGTYGSVAASVVFDNFGSMTGGKSQTWGTSGGSDHPRVLTVNTPVGAPPEKQCGKGVHIDAHVSQGGGGGGIFGSGGGSDVVDSRYPLSCTAPLSQPEAMFAFFFFDLASCIQKESEVPAPPPPVR